MRNILIIVLIFGGIYFKLFMGIFNDEMAIRESINLNQTFIDKKLFQQLVGHDVFKLHKSLDTHLKSLRKLT